MKEQNEITFAQITNPSADLAKLAWLSRFPDRFFARFFNLNARSIRIPFTYTEIPHERFYEEKKTRGECAGKYHEKKFGFISN